jgi:hypothetical protein
MAFSVSDAYADLRAAFRLTLRPRAARRA